MLSQAAKRKIPQYLSLGPESLVNSLLPLFPLDTVLLPATVLPLHIFEPRYKEMVSECLTLKKAFGVVRAKENEGLAEIGCTAEILEVTKKYPDGRMDILTEGRAPFEVMEVNQERPFLQADILFLHDSPGLAPDQDILRAVTLYGEIMDLTGVHKKTSDTRDPQLSFALAGSLPLDLDFKQALLGMRSEAERMQAVISFFETVLPTLRLAVQARKRASGNGHAR